MTYKEWKKYKIEDLCEVLSSKRIYAADYVSKGIPFYRSKEIIQKSLGQEIDKILYISKDKFFDIKNKYGVPNENDILISAVGERSGIPYLVKKEIFYFKDGNLIWLRNFKNKIIDSKYLCYWLKSSSGQNSLNNLMIGSAQRALTIIGIKNLFIALPPLDIQQKIAKVLSAIDDKIELNNSINNNLEQQAQAIFKSWFVDFEPFGGTMPKFAELVPIEKICKIVTKGTTPTTLGFSFVEQGINFIKAESILDNHSFDYNKFAYIDEVTYKKLSRSILEPKDIVFTIAGTLGRFAIIDEEVIPANTNQAVAIIRADIGKIEPEYLYTFFLGNWHNNYYSKRIQQAVQANLNLTTIKSLPIILLSQEYRIKYLNIIKPILWQIKYNEKENRILTQLRDTLLPKLMSGEIDVSKVEIDDILENQFADK